MQCQRAQSAFSAATSASSACPSCSTSKPVYRIGTSCRSHLRSDAGEASTSAPSLARRLPARQQRTQGREQDRQSEERCISLQRFVAPGAAALVASTVLSGIWPEGAQASGGSFSGEALELFTKFLEQVEQMGPLGAVLFVAVVTVFEMIPLFPTQPLSLASGLLFGAKEGGLLMLLGVTLAAVNAFLISKGVGRPLAEKVIDFEMSHDDEKGSIHKSIAQVQAAIDGGGTWKQFTAIVLLRLTPVVPFSASNYVLGLTPVQFPAFLGGTIAGMTVWSFLYASLGGASRALLDSGADMNDLLADLTDKAATLSSSALGVTGGVAAAGLAVFAARTLLGRAETQTASSGNGNGVSSNGNGSNGNGRSAASSSEARREQETVSTGVSAGGQRE